MGARMFLAAVAERNHMIRTKQIMSKGKLYILHPDTHRALPSNAIPQVHQLYQLAPGRWWQSGRSLRGHWNWMELMHLHMFFNCCHSQKSTTSTRYFSFVHWCLRRTMEPTRRQEMIGNADCWDSNIRQKNGRYLMLPKTCDAAIPVMVHGGNSHAWQAYLDAPLDDMLMRCLILCVRSHDFSWKCTKYASCSAHCSGRMPWHDSNALPVLHAHVGRPQTPAWLLDITNPQSRSASPSEFVMHRWGFLILS